MSKSPTISDSEWLPNDHASDMLAGEFLEPLGMDVGALARAIQVPKAIVTAAIDGITPISGELDLRLTRYFGMSEGFFLRLQTQYEIVEAKRALNGALDRIVPRAA